LSTRAPLRDLLAGALACAAATACPAAMALTISGPPAGAVITGHAYSFTPAATSTSGKTLVFKIANKPAWAIFSSSNGRLSGTPASTSAGYYYHIAISVSDGTSTAALPQFMIAVHRADTSPPVVSGTPPTSVTAGSAYTFQPHAVDPAGNGMYFTIHNKPAWATFSIYTGLLTGKPTSAQVGTYSNIQIYAEDGQMAGALRAFSITVRNASTASSPGKATVNWTRPTKNTNGTALTDLAGYRLRFGTSPSNLSSVVQLPNASLATYTVGNLLAATWYFAITAYTTTGVESSMSPIVSKAVN
jgi:hypothetical protein